MIGFNPAVSFSEAGCDGELSINVFRLLSVSSPSSSELLLPDFRFLDISSKGKGVSNVDGGLESEPELSSKNEGVSNVDGTLESELELSLKSEAVFRIDGTPETELELSNEGGI